MTRDVFTKTVYIYILELHFSCFALSQFKANY